MPLSSAREISGQSTRAAAVPAKPIRRTLDSIVRIANLHAALTTSGDWVIGWRASELPGSYATLDSRPCASPNPWQIGDSRKYLAVNASRPSIVNVGSASAIVLVLIVLPGRTCISPRSKFRFDLAVNLELTGEIPAEEFGLEDTDKGRGADLP